jgi:hypothetical protein
VLDLHSMGMALRVRWLWLQQVNPNRPWSAMVLEEDQTIKAFFHASVRWEVGNGAHIRFWTDPWLDGRAIIDLFPELTAVVPPWRHRTRLLCSVLARDF